MNSLILKKVTNVFRPLSTCILLILYSMNLQERIVAVVLVKLVFSLSLVSVWCRLL